MPIRVAKVQQNSEKTAHYSTENTKKSKNDACFLAFFNSQAFLNAF
jgi:hypothetical protein